MATREIKTRIALDGEKEYKQKIRELNQEQSLYKSQLEKLDNAQKGQANSVAALEKKVQALNNVYNTMKDKVTVSREALENAKRVQEEYRQKVEAAAEKVRQTADRQKELGDVTAETAGEHAKLREEMDKYEKELEEAQEGEKKASESVMDWETKTNNMETQLRKMGKELSDNKGYLEEAKQSTNGCASSIDEYGNKVKKATEETDEFGERTSAAVEALAASMVASGVKKAFEEIVQVLTACVDASVEFESAVAKVGTIADAEKIPLGQLKDEIMKLSGELGVGVSEIAESAYGAISASVDTANAVGFVEKATKLAAGGFTDTATAVDILSTAINAYGLETDQAGQISDYLITTQNLGKTTVSELASKMGQVIPVAAAYNVEMDNLSSAYAVLTANGINTARSTTYLKSMLSELGDSGSTVSEVLKEKTGSSFGDLMKKGMSLGDIMEILGESVEGDAGKFNELWSSSEAGVGALSLLNAGSERYNSVLRAMGDSTGAAEEAFEKMADTTEFAKKRMDTAFSNLKITIGDQLTPAIRKMNEAGADILGWASDFLKEHQEIVPLIAAAASALGVLTAAFAGYLAVTKLVIPAMAEFSAALAANPFGMTALALGTLAAAVGTLVAITGDAETETDKLIKKTEELKEAVDGTIEEYNSQREQTKENADAQKALAEELETVIRAEGRTEAGKKKIAELVDQLNASVPNLSLAYDEQANSLHLTTEAIETMIDAQKKEDEFDSHLEERTELLKQKTEATASAEEAERELAKAEEDLQKMYEDGAGCWDASGNLIDNQRILVADLTKAYDDMTQAVADIDEQLAESNTYIEDYTIANSGMSESTLAARDSTLEMAEALGENTEEYAAVREAVVALDEQYIEHVSEQQARIEEIKEQQEQLKAAYDETYQNVYDNLTGEMGLFQEMSTKADQNIKDLIKGLDSQIAYMDTYAENIKKAMELGVDQGLVNKLSDGSEESAKILQAIVDDGGEHVDELNEKLGKVEEGKEAFSRQVAEMETNFTESWNTMQSELEKNVQAMNKEEEAYRAGVDTVNGYIKGSESQRRQVMQTYKSLAAAAIAAAKRELNQNSPSKVFEEIGANNIRGDIKGAEKERGRLEDTYEESAREAIAA